MNSFDFISIMLGLRSSTLNFGGGGASAGPTAQQVALQTEQAVTNAQLNLEENEQRKVMLNALQGTRVFRGSALSRQMSGDRAATAAPLAPPASAAQTAVPILAPIRNGSSLLDNIPGSSAAPGAAGSGNSGGTGRNIFTPPGLGPAGRR